MRPTSLLLAAAVLVVGNPFPGADTSLEAADMGTLCTTNPCKNKDNNHSKKNLWAVSFFDQGQCWGDSDATLSSHKPNSKCFKYNDGIGHELKSITFKHPRGDPDCLWGCDNCKINVYYPPKGEKADCCDEHKVKRDWTQKDVGKCIDIEPPKDARVRYKIDCS
ncbi:hypothetical protein JX265_004489 [Neoarthrinium moseri]|uniref:Secreted protein n=1 Tax=Neoarthrinium moseri TaxID=1658444 RepID=A0A9P9WQU2_9PEZI|nr:uncharacterized protein JN550_008190 [Neoarthrinium moseri]KAI1840364.1 hypothetical protein JX266_013417 [Neoarthrinium moseri]KAI1865932.1 hypothetical protein JN550_008190 [Neoarthrinium moseri]KAI1875431.1 hypothetical protein JX265_004489 [Neoarthrinium moseri]